MDSECDRDLLQAATPYCEQNPLILKTRNKLRYYKPYCSNLKCVILSSNDYIALGCSK